MLAAFGTLFICGGIQGYQACIGDLRRAGALEWPLRVLLVIGGFVVATPGGGIMPLSQMQITLAGACDSRAHRPDRGVPDPPAIAGREPVARALIAVQNEGDESRSLRPGPARSRRCCGFSTSASRIRRDEDGAVADYIPELSKADPAHFGISLATLDGHVYEVGDSTVPFTIQSMSKPFVFALALDTLGAARVEARSASSRRAIPSTRSGSTADNHPFNPMVNAGAIACSGLIHEAKGDGAFEYIREALGRFAGRELGVDEAVYASESADRRPQPRHRLSAAHQCRAEGPCRCRARRLLPPMLDPGHRARSSR